MKTIAYMINFFSELINKTKITKIKFEWYNKTIQQVTNVAGQWLSLPTVFFNWSSVIQPIFY